MKKILPILALGAAAIIFALICILIALFAAAGKINESTLKTIVPIVGILSSFAAVKVITKLKGEHGNAGLNAIICFGLIMLLGTFFGGKTITCAISASLVSGGLLLGTVKTKRIKRARPH